MYRLTKQNTLLDNSNQVGVTKFTSVNNSFDDILFFCKGREKTCFILRAFAKKCCRHSKFVRKRITSHCLTAYPFHLYVYHHFSEDKELDEFEKTFTMADLDIEEKEAGEEGAEEGGEEGAAGAEAEDDSKEEVGTSNLLVLNH